MRLLAWILPPQAAVLVLIAVGAAIMLGQKRIARGLLGVVAVMILGPLLTPVAFELLGAFPLWIRLLVMAWLGLALLRSILAAVLGRHAADTTVGHLASEGILGALRLLFLPIRWLFRRV